MYHCGGMWTSSVILHEPNGTPSPTSIRAEREWTIFPDIIAQEKNYTWYVD